jgi:hypothetical protein
MNKMNRILLVLTICALCPAAGMADGSWRDAGNRAILENDALRAEFQSGVLFGLAGKTADDPFMSGDPAKLDGMILVFGDSGINLDECVVSHEATEDSIVSRFRAPDGSRWEMNWSIHPGKGDLVLHTSARASEPVRRFQVPFHGLDINDHALVLVNGQGSALERRAPWNEELSGSVPLALFQGSISGWALESRELDTGTASVLAKGTGEKANLSMARWYPAITRVPSGAEIRIRRYTTHWADAVDPYLDWMEEEAGFVSIEKKQPTWVKDVRAQAYLHPWDFEGLELLAKRVDPTQTLLGRVTDFNRLPFPYYKPAPKCEKWFKRARELGFHVGAHVNTTGVTRDIEELVARFQRGFLYVWTDEEGNERYENQPPHAGRVILKTPDGDKTASGVDNHAYCSPALKEFRDFFVGQMKPLVDAGVDLIYLDECGGNGRGFIDGMTSGEGVMLMMKTIAETYPEVALMTEQYNLTISRHASFALTTLNPGHPLSGYIFSRFIHVVPEWHYYEPTNEKHMDQHQSWGFMVPGGSRNESWVQIGNAFTKYRLEPDVRLPLGPNQLFGYRGAGGVTAFYEKEPTRRGLAVYEPGKEPTTHGTRVTGVSEWSGPGALENWPFYRGKTLLALNPEHTYGFDESITLRADRFHVTSVPPDFALYASEKERRIPVEVGVDAEYFRIHFTGSGELTMHVPDEWMVCVDDRVVPVDGKAETARVRVDAPEGDPSVLMAFQKIDAEIAGDTVDLPWQLPVKQNMIYWNQCYTENTHYAHRSEYAGIVIGKVPDAPGIRLQTEGEGEVRVNGKTILKLPGKKRLEADLTPYAGQHVIIEFSSDGGGWVEYRRPAMWRSIYSGMSEDLKKEFILNDYIGDVGGDSWYLKGWWKPRVVL